MIEVVKNRSELKSVKDIYIILGFANIYRNFIKKFSKIITLLILILKTTEKLIYLRASTSKMKIP